MALQSKKEYLQFKLPHHTNEEKKSQLHDIEMDIRHSEYIQLSSNQLLMRNFISPNSGEKRVLIKWDTGIGKTFYALSSALEYIKYIRRQPEEEQGSVFVLGFTRDIFKNDLMKYPEFGFISREELEYMKKLQSIAKSNNRIDLDKLAELRNKITRRFSNRKGNGFFQFYGYREFVNNIFLSKDSSVDINVATEDEIHEALKNGTLKFNVMLLNQFKNSFLICDEVHQIYNSREKNNWGIAIQAILDYWEDLHAIYLSATPLNSPSEIVNLINILVDKNQKVKFEDLFLDVDKLRPDAYQKIAKLLANKISFLKDTNLAYFPTKTYIGEKIKGIDYLKFTRCKMTPLQLKTYKYVIKKDEEFSKQDLRYLCDIVFPNPADENVGLFTQQQIKKAVNSAPQEWKEKHSIEWNGQTVSGKILEYNNLKKYSTKYSVMIELLFKCIKSEAGKIMIFHNNVINTGAMLIQQILNSNGFIEDGNIANENTVCMKCGEQKINHGNAHNFVAACYVVLYSEIDASIRKKAIERYNSPENKHGEQILILIGSRLIKESYDFKAIRNLFVMSRPDNIPTLIQVIGRSARKNSHILLPNTPQMRNVNIYLFVSSIGDGTLSYEEDKYKQKIESYKIIQKIEKIMHENAIDAFINEHIIKKAMSKDDLSILPYQAKAINIKKIDISTFSAYYGQEEVDNIKFLLKRIFIEISPIWKYKELWHVLRFPPRHWQLNVNPEMFLEENFRIALTQLLWKQNSYEPLNFKSTSMISNLFNPSEKIIVMPGGAMFVVCQVGDFYCIFPVLNGKPNIDYDMFLRPMFEEAPRSINIKNYLEEQDPKIDFQQKKLKFKRRFEHYPLENMENVICEYGSEFHKLFMEEAIEYIFNFWTGKMKKSEYHEFYFKMLSYYDIMGLIIWAETAKAEIVKKYEKYITDPKPFSSLEKKNIKNEDNDIVKLLKSSLSNAGCKWCPDDIKEKFYKSLQTSLEFSDKQEIKQKKVPSNILPIGHFMTKIPRFYMLEGVSEWTDMPNYISFENTVWQENPIIIGYDEKSQTGIHIRFKIRSPIQNIKQYKDSRKIEKGSICSSKSKTYLLNIATKLGIETPKGDMTNIMLLCNQIRLQLVYNEIKERKNPKSKVKWFYHFYDYTRPETLKM